MALSPKQNTRVLILTHEFYPRRGGIAVYVEETARAAAQSGWDVEVWAPRHPRIAARNWDFKILEIPNRGSLDWTCRSRLMWMLWRNRQSLDGATIVLPEPGPIHVCMYMRGLIAARCQRIIPILHGSEILRFCALPHRKRLFAGLLRQSACIGVVSEFVRRLLRQRFPWADSKTVIVSGALRGDFRPQPAEKKDVSEPSPKVLTVARIHPRKGQLEIVRAMAGLPDDLKAHWTYCVAGPVSRQSYLRQVQREAEAGGVRLRLAGAPADAELAAVYADADIFAMTSHTHKRSVEGFGLAYLEAGAAGLPVLAWRTGGVAEAVRQNDNGWVLPPGNIPALTIALEKLMRDPTLRKKLGDGGRSRVRELSWTHNVECLLAG